MQAIVVGFSQLQTISFT